MRDGMGYTCVHLPSLPCSPGNIDVLFSLPFFFFLVHQHIYISGNRVGEHFFYGVY